LALDAAAAHAYLTAMTAPTTIAIVGRPNVGKSTLFNRLTGRRQALVSDMPGLTRDRREAEGELEGHQVRFVDTAGLEDGPAGSLSARMRQQTEAGMRMADLVLFVIDARDGVVPTDQQFARLVHATGKPAILVANKCEGKRGLDGMYEAFALGLGDPVPISAEHGEGLVDLVHDMMAALGLKTAVPAHRLSRREMKAGQEDAGPAPPPEPAIARPMRIAIAGRPNVGKSTLVNALLGEDRMITGPEPGLTRDAIASELDWKGRPVRLFDTAGLRRKARVEELAEKLGVTDTLRAIRFAEVVVLVVDAERPFEQQDLTIGQLVAEEGRAIVIAVNKWDLVADKQKLFNELREIAAERLSQVHGVTLVPVSALAERGLDRLMEAALAAYDVWNKRVATRELNRWLGEAMSRHAPPASRGRRIKVRYITQPSTRPPTFVGFCQRADGMPESYKRYLVNSLRETFGMPGTPIRFQLRKGDNPFADK
jgi:GTP-binding protein